MSHLALSFYQFFLIESVEETVASLKKTLEELDAKGRIYISQEGINAQLSLEKGAYDRFCCWKRESPFAKAPLKVQETSEHAFEKLTVKIREQLCAFDVPVDFSEASSHLSPQEWKKRLDAKDPNTFVVDVRNRYESDVGHFSGAILPPVDSFREFPAYAEELEKKVDKNKQTVLMYCTGGIRCEYYSAYLKKRGFKQVFQLQGGVIQYAEEMGASHWKGKLFVFDDRMTVPIGSQEVLSTCIYCEEPSDLYYNCANMDCNKLFTCCSKCAQAKKGLCSSSCSSGRVRPFDESEHPKPFRKLRGS